MLIQGESGTGKELVARALHDSSKRSLKPYITVDCTGLPETLIESELFGHEKGAFTGAYALKRGLVEEADGGTLFLDEIGDIPLGLQAKLLRFLETGMYRRVGSNQVLHADVRLVSATHRILKDLVATNEFRNDLYYRVSAFPIWVPRLTERKEDLPLLVASLLKRLPKGDAFKLDKAALNFLEAYPFPGNIRELKNILERAVILCDGRLITPAHLPPEVTGFVAAAHDNVLASGNVAGRIDDIGQLLQEGFTRQEIAEKLQVSERTVYRILKALK
ncbi:sigma-54-dependent Fis family transcriptional regulator [bacterium]|nr:sigma-54-dependent Fis family transcriptional regulator [bacterium]